MRFGITSGYNQSPTVLYLMQSLAKAGLVPEVCLNVSTFNFARAGKMMTKYGPAATIRKFQSLVLGNPDRQLRTEYSLIREKLSNCQPSFSTVRSACNSAGISFLTVKDLNSTNTQRRLQDLDLDMMIYMGGGILKPKFISSFRLGILNAHHGGLPFFRGMNVVEWSLLYGVQPSVSVHMIDKGIDTGDILRILPIECNENDTLETLRGKAMVLGVKALVEILVDFESYNRAKQTQTPAEGKQFFIMHPFLKNVVIEGLEKGQIPMLPLRSYLNAKDQSRNLFQ